MCDHCKFWSDPTHEDEMFSYLWGYYWFNVAEAYKIVEGREPEEVSVADAAEWVEYPPKEDGSFRMDKRHALIEHLDHVDMSKPILFARYPQTIPKYEEELKGAALLIDGTHRICRAVRDGHPTIKAYVLSEEETERILIDNSGRKKPKAKKPRKKKSNAQSR